METTYVSGTAGLRPSHSLSDRGRSSLEGKLVSCIANMEEGVTYGDDGGRDGHTNSCSIGKTRSVFEIRCRVGVSGSLVILTRTVAHAVRQDGRCNISAAGLVGTVAKTVGEAGVVAKAGGIGCGTGGAATKTLLLVDHVLDAGLLGSS